MGQAIFLAVARNSKLKARVAQLRGAAGRAFVEGLFFRARLRFEAFSPRRYFLAMARLMNDIRTEKDKEIRKGRNHRCFFRDWAGHEPEKKKSG